MDKESLETVINYGLSKGLDYVELFLEKKEAFIMSLSKSKVEESLIKETKGIGIRLLKDDLISYGYTSDISINNLKSKIDKLALIFDLEKPKSKKIKLGKKRIAPIKKDIIYLEQGSKEKIKEVIQKIDYQIRSLDKRVANTEVAFSYMKRIVTVASSDKKYVEEQRVKTLMMVQIYLKEKDKLAEGLNIQYLMGGLEFLNNDDTFNKQLKKALKQAQNKLRAVNIEGGKMPVIISHGRGAVLFHEAVGHSLEAEQVVNQETTFNPDMIGKKIASSIVNLVDDGRRKGLNGYAYFDDEGNNTRKNILIENGILRNYLVDKVNGLKLNMSATGSSRRESYKIAPVSRMNNTYLVKGKDKIKDMIKSIDYGVYVYDLGGGEVETITGDFSFGVNLARLIEKGKLTKWLKEITLVGKCNEVLENVEMISNDLDFGAGTCGANSGWVPVTEGQATIKVREMTVGGKK